MKNLVSIILTTCNDGEWLVKTIKSIIKRTRYSNYEIIVISNGTYDNSIDLVKREIFFSEITLIDILEPLGISRARNLGAYYAKGDYLLFLDAHVLVNTKNHIEEFISESKKHSDFCLLGSRITNLPGGWSQFGSTWSFCLNDLYNHKFVGDLSLNPFDCFAITGGVCFISQKAFNYLEGFDEGIIQWGGEAFELCIRSWLIGIKVLIHPNIEYFHRVKNSGDFKYPRSWMAINYNNLRIASLYFDDKRLIDTFEYSKHFPEYNEAIYSLLQNNITQRKDSFKRKQVKSIDWLFSKFRNLYAKVEELNYKKIEVELSEINNILVVVAHPDDEALWVSGTIQKNKNYNWKIACVTCGYDVVRKNEFINSCNAIGVQFEIWDFQEGYDIVLDEDLLINKINGMQADFNYDLIITHNQNGEYGHPQHKQINQIIKSNIAVPKVYFGWDTQDDEIFVIPISIVEKNGIINCHKSQRQVIPELVEWVGDKEQFICDDQFNIDINTLFNEQGYSKENYQLAVELVRKNESNYSYFTLDYFYDLLLESDKIESLTIIGENIIVHPEYQILIYKLENIQMNLIMSISNDFPFNSLDDLRKISSKKIIFKVKENCDLKSFIRYVEYFARINSSLIIQLNLSVRNADLFKSYLDELKLIEVECIEIIYCDSYLNRNNLKLKEHLGYIENYPYRDRVLYGNKDFADECLFLRNRKLIVIDVNGCFALCPNQSTLIKASFEKQNLYDYTAIKRKVEEDLKKSGQYKCSMCFVE